MRMRAFVAGASLLWLLAAGAEAEPAVYTWSGAGHNVSGSTKCESYKMTIEVTVDGSAVKGTFHQQGREQREFEATLDGNGSFKTKAKLGGGTTMDVHGVISAKESNILLDGYCKFQGKLTKK